MKLSVVLFIFLVWKASFPVLAQKADTSVVAPLPPITILGTAPAPVSNTPSFVISQKGFEKINAHNVADAVQTAPGVVIKDYGGVGGLKTVSVRSLGAEHTAVFLDGIKIANVQSGQVDLGRFSLQNIQQIQFCKDRPGALGNTASAYLHAASLFINTDNQFKTLEKARIEGSLAYGSFDYFSPSLLLKKGFKESAFAEIDAVYRKNKGDYPFSYKNGDYLTSSTRKNSDVQDLCLNSNIGYKFNTKNKLLLKGYLNAGERGVPGAIILYNTNSAARLYNSDLFVQGVFTHSIDDSSGIRVFGKAGNAYMKYEDANWLNLAGNLKNIYNQQEYFSSLCFFQEKKKYDLNMASDMYLNTLKTNSLYDLYPARFTSVSALSFAPQFKRIKPAADLVFTYVKDFDQAINYTKKVFTPGVSVLYTLWKNNVSLRASYKRTFRMPAFSDLYYSLIGTHTLKPEFASNYNIGLIYVKDKPLFMNYIRFQADLFYMKVKDKIMAVPTKNAFVWSMQNLGLVETKGVELFTKSSVPLNKATVLILTGTYTFQQALDVTHPNTSVYRNQISYTPYETANATISVERKRININYSLLYSGFRYSLGENIPENYLEPFTIQDASFSYSWKLFNIKAELKLEVNNLFNIQYEFIRSFPMPGRSFLIKFKFKYA